MRRLFSMIIVVLVCCGIFAGCNAEKAPETMADDIFISESISVISENAFSFQNSDYSDIAFESYLHEHGTSSINSSILIYRY